MQELLKFVGLVKREDDRVCTYSSGMKQRIRFAAALLFDPPLLLLDEPTVNLDASGLELVERIREQQCKREGILVVATNVKQETEQYEHVLRMDDYR